MKATFLFLIVLVLTVHSTLSLPSHRRASQSSTGIAQVIEHRRGQVFCRGVVIQLGKFRFRDTIKADQIVIREAKHGHDLKEIMSWQVARNGKQLVVKFKPGMGDFGGGNRVEVQVDRSAIIGSNKSPNNRFDWSIGTDVL